MAVSQPNENASGGPRSVGSLGYFVPEFPTQTHAFFWREIQALEALGTKVRVFSTQRPPADACPHDFAEEARSRTAYVFPPRWIPALGYLLARPVRTARALGYVLSLDETQPLKRLSLVALLPSAAELCLRARQDGIRHVHFHSVATSLHVGAIANILSGLTYSATVHGDLPVYGTDHARKFSRATLVTAVTRPLKGDVERVSPGTPTAMIWMGVDVDRFRPNDAGLAPGAPFRFLTVARLNRTKGHRYFLEALKRLRDRGADVAYTIVGSGPAREEIESEIAKLGLSECVTLAGSLSETGVLDLLRQADGFVLPSFGKGEAAPVSVMEAMACGVPVICSVIGGTPDLIDDGKDGLLTPQQDIDALEAAAWRLVTDAVFRADIGTAARATALAKFDYRAKARDLLDAINAALVG